MVIQVAHEISSQTFQCETYRLWWASQPTLATEWTGMRLDQHDVALTEGANPLCSTRYVIFGCSPRARARYVHQVGGGMHDMG